jgi:peptidoglycan/LPS O-acetylase OafA/YrhL
MVVLSHYSIILRYEPPFLHALTHGVDLFFVLSGFLISRLLFSEYERSGTIDLKRFWIRRGLKIYPGFYTLMLPTATVLWFSFHRMPREILSEIFFLQNYRPHLWVHSWSLAVEEHFYFCLPLLLFLLAQTRKRRQNCFRIIPLLSVGISALCLYLRILAFRHGDDWGQVAFPTHLRIDALFAGVTLGYYAHFDPESFAEGGRRVILIVGLFFGLALLVMPNLADLTIAYVSSAFIVAWAVNQPASSTPIATALAWVGRYSYSIYLWHAAAILFVIRLAVHWLRFPLYVAVAIMLGVIMAKMVELPSLKLRDRLFPSLANPARVISSRQTVAAPSSLDALGTASLVK